MLEWKTSVKKATNQRGEILKYNINKLIITITLLICLFVIVLLKPSTKMDNDSKNYIISNVTTNFVGNYKDINEFNIEKEKEEQRKKLLVYEDMTKDELVKMLNNSLNSTISNKGELIATYSLQKGVDPVVATAIMLLETGCKWECRYLVKACNNVGGVKGAPGCNGSYKRYSSLDTGIKHFISNLSDNYYKKGLNTPEKMNKKYAQSSTWATKVNNYVKEIKAAN